MDGSLLIAILFLYSVCWVSKSCFCKVSEYSDTFFGSKRCNSRKGHTCILRSKQCLCILFSVTAAFSWMVTTLVAVIFLKPLFPSENDFFIENLLAWWAWQKENLPMWSWMMYAIFIALKTRIIWNQSHSLFSLCSEILFRFVIILQMWTLIFFYFLFTEVW